MSSWNAEIGRLRRQCPKQRGRAHDEEARALNLGELDLALTFARVPGWSADATTAPSVDIVSMPIVDGEKFPATGEYDGPSRASFPPLSNFQDHLSSPSRAAPELPFTSHEGQSTMETAPSREGQSTTEKALSQEWPSTMEKAPSYERHPTMENAPIHEVQPTMENAPGHEGQSTMEKAPVHEVPSTIPSYLVPSALRSSISHPSTHSKPHTSRHP